MNKNANQIEYFQIRLISYLRSTILKMLQYNFANVIFASSSSLWQWAMKHTMAICIHKYFLYLQSVLCCMFYMYVSLCAYGVWDRCVQIYINDNGNHRAKLNDGRCSTHHLPIQWYRVLRGNWDWIDGDSCSANINFKRNAEVINYFIRFYFWFR